MLVQIQLLALLIEVKKMIKIQGSTFRKELVLCFSCGKAFSWLYGTECQKGMYVARCAKCRRDGITRAKSITKVFRK
jgi:NAD-dependent SIR2 family protein deacetylase